MLPNKRKRKTEALVSTEIQKEDSVLQPKENTSACLLRHTCKEISVTDYKNCLFRKDLSSLVIEGNPTEEELQAAWEDVFFDYGSYLKSDDTSYQVLIVRDIGILKYHTVFVEHALRYLREEYDMHIAGELREIGYNENFEEKDKERLAAIHNRVESLCKTKRFELEVLQDEYDRYLKQKDGGEDTSEEDFDKNTIMLSQYLHYPIDEDKTTAYKYVMIYNSYIADFKARSKQAEHE